MADSGSVGSIEHVVQRGQTLWGIAKQHLGDGNRYREIHEANRALIGRDPHAVRPGMKLVVPQAGPVAATDPAARSHEPRPQAFAPAPAGPTPAAAAPANGAAPPPPPAVAPSPSAPPPPAPPAAALGLPELAPAASAPPAPPAPPVPPPSRPTVQAEAPGATPAATLRSFWSPSGTGANTTVTGRLFVGATLREGAGAPPANWAGVPSKPYREVFAGFSTSDLIVDAGGRLDAVQPRAVTGYWTGDGKSNFGLQLWTDVEADLAGNRRVGAEATYATLGPDGKPRSRLDLQVASPPSVPDATPQLAGRAEKFVPFGADHVLRLRAFGAYSGKPGETIGVAASAAIDPPPNIGTFPGGKRDAPMRPSLEIAAAHAPAPLPGQPGRATDTVQVTAALASPTTVLTTTLSSARTGDVTKVRLAGTAMTRLGANDIGDPPTTVAVGGVDPINMPVGRFPDGKRGSNTTAYSRFVVTLADDGPQPKAGTAFPGPDSATLGVTHTRSHGVLAGAYLQGVGDLTNYAPAAQPVHRTAVTAGMHLRPSDGFPVTIHVSGNAGGGGNTASVGLTLMPDKNTAIEGGPRYDFDRREWQGYAKVGLRF